MLHRYGAFVARRARLLLVLSVLLMVGAGVLGAGRSASSRTAASTTRRAESTQAQQLIDDRFGGQTNLVLLVTAKAGTVDRAGGRTAGDRDRHGAWRPRPT